LTSGACGSGVLMTVLIPASHDIHAATIMPMPRRPIRIVSVARFLSRLPRYKRPLLLSHGPSMEMIRSKGERKQFIKRSHSAVDQLDVGSTRGDRIKLARPVSFTGSLALAVPTDANSAAAATKPTTLPRIVLSP
jgi:hypothetical protein